MKMTLGKFEKIILNLKGSFIMLNVVIGIQASDFIREQMEKYMAEQPCPTCKGYRLKKRSIGCFD